MNKPITKICVALLVLVGALHLLRFVSGMEVIVAGVVAPVWISLPAAALVLLLAFLLWREID